MAMAEIPANMVFSFNDGMVLIKGYVLFATAKYKAKAACATQAYDYFSAKVVSLMSCFFVSLLAAFFSL